MTSTALTLGDASRATGKVKSTVLRAIKDGKISAKKNENGEWQIEPSELFRVFPPATVATVSETGESNDTQPPETLGETGGLAAELKVLRERMQMTGQMHETQLGLLNDRIEELRQDREDLRHERDKLLTTLQEQALSVRLLTDQRPHGPQDQPPDQPKGDQPRRGLFSFFKRTG